jgi:excinuclease ABC subunit A
MSDPSPSPVIRLRGVRQNNLKNFDLDLPLGRLIVLTGPSGSGKSSLAFETLFAEGQRRYIETFSPYARQFFDRMDKPAVDSIEGIPPAIAIEQRNAVRTTRSTVGTMTELCDHMKLLWQHLARLHCRGCGSEVRRESPQDIWSILTDPASGTPDSDRLVTFDLPLSEKLSLTDSLTLISKQGYQRLIVGGRVLRVDEAADAAADFTSTHRLTVIQDRLRPSAAGRARFIEACEQAYHFGKGRLTLWGLGVDGRPTDPRPFSNRLHCASCNLDYRDPSPALFSYNHPVGACPECKGFGRVIRIDSRLAIPDHSRTLAGGAVKPWQTGVSAECQQDMMRYCRIRKVPTNVPFRDLERWQQDWVVEGDKDYGIDEAHQWPHAWYGVKGYFRWLESKSYKMHVRVLLSRYRSYSPCPVCHGTRFQPDAMLYILARPSAAGATVPQARTGRGFTIADFYALTVRESLDLVEAVRHARPFGTQDPLGYVLEEVRARLAYLDEVGLGYLSLDRPTRTLSGGETERVNLTTCLGTRLVNTLYILDEPSVGLHPRDTDRLVRILERLRDTGNTVVVVEHEAAVIRAADQMIDLGPGSGERGGHVVFQGTLAEAADAEASLTGAYLSGRRRIEMPVRRPVTHDQQTPPRWLSLSGATLHNLHQLDVRIPRERLVCITGVSGSGKTTLVRELLLPALQARLNPHLSPASSTSGDDEDGSEDTDETAAANSTGATLSGCEGLGQVVLVDQSPLGRTPRSNPVVYIGAFDDIRDLFAASESAKGRGLDSSDFSFNSQKGQCQRCRGAGFEKIEMQFLSDVFIRCPDCAGRRYRPHVLDFKLVCPSAPGSTGSVLTAETAGWSIADLLEATVDDATEFLSRFPGSRPAARAVQGLRLLQDVGLGYLRLGQPINTLSGGESQRIKLISHLADATERLSLTAAASNGDAKLMAPATSLFLFDEPTTGLHFDDVRVLLGVFQRLVDAGNSVVVIEHNLEVIKCADWVIDMGPEAGAGGGRIVASGTPETVAACEASLTGRALREVMDPEAQRASALAMREIAPAWRASSETASIVVSGAREHNLKNLSVELPRDRLVVITGVSGSGKSTLAFDLLFNEGQRRFLDSMNAYARQFVEQMARPDVDCMSGLPPTVSIEQRTSRGGGKSTVATVTEVQHFLRLLFARLGTQHCPDCHVAVEAQTRDALEQRLRQESRRRGDLLLLAPVVRNRKGFHTDVAEAAARNGFREVRADGKIHDTSKPLRLDRFKEHTIELVVGVFDRAGGGPKRPRKRRGAATEPPGSQRTPRDYMNLALEHGRGVLLALDNHGKTTVHSTERACPSCGRSFEALDPKQFSYNSPQGWCPKCRGFGELFYLPEDVDRGARADAIEESWFGWMEGRREPCPECGGARLNPVARAVRLRALGVRAVAGAASPTEAGSGPCLDDFSAASVEDAFAWFRTAKPRGDATAVARDILPEIRERLKFLCEVGLGYLQMGRSVTTLSGGEAQRIRLAAQLGSNLSGVLYILDEPTIGLHARDNEQLLATLLALKDRGNSLVVVEHDEETMRRADYIIDLGPGAGVRGGEVIAAGTLQELLAHKDSITGQCLRSLEGKHYPTRGERRQVAPIVPQTKRSPRAAKSTTTAAGAGWLLLEHATTHNLHDLSVALPLNRLVVITGVSGSGKSTLVRECLLPALEKVVKARKPAQPAPGAPRVTGWESLKAVYEVDQSPIGRTPRSTPATYVGFFDDIRALFAQTPEARMRGYGAGRFSFNSAQGRCPACDGAGNIKLEMNFLPPAYVRCETCNGTRFNADTLDITFHGLNVAQVLDLSVEEALTFFEAHPRIRRPLEALHDTGLDYLRLGQTSPTLSGGEAQRVKLVTHLLTGLKEAPERRLVSLNPSKRNLFILEEPTIGLHISDVRRLVEVLQRLVDAGHSVIVIEHNLELIAEADWVVDLGPEGGEGGGRLVAEGPPERISVNRRSHTGRFLRRLLPSA